MRKIWLLAVASLLFSPLLAHSTEFCSGADNMEKRLDCWNRLSDQKEAKLRRAVAASKRQAKATGKTYGLDIPETLQLIDKSMRAWKDYVDHECALQRDSVGSGWDRNSVEENCYLTKLDERIREIRRYWPQ